MARTSVEIIDILRKTAAKLETTADYQWGHMGSCNCGFLTQEITRLNKTEIHRRAMASHGDWTEQLNDYCSSSGLPLDAVITEMVNFGFDVDDLRHLERLSDPSVLGYIPIRPLLHNHKPHVVLYIRTWAEQLDRRLLEDIRLSDLKLNAKNALTAV